MSVFSSTSLRSFLQPVEVFPTEMPQFRVKMDQVYKNIAFNVNLKEIGVYDLTEYLTGKQFFTPGNPDLKRQAFRKVVPFSAVLVAGLNVQAHGITTTPAFTFTHIYGTGKNAAGTLWVPFPQGGANTSMLEIDPININLTVPAAYAGFSAIIVLEYIKT